MKKGLSGDTKRHNKQSVYTLIGQIEAAKCQIAQNHKI